MAIDKIKTPQMRQPWAYPALSAADKVKKTHPIKGPYYTDPSETDEVPVDPEEITLAALSGSFTLVENATQGNPAGTVGGQTPGSVLSLFDDAGGRVQISGDTIEMGPTPLDYESSLTHSFTVRETLVGATNSPRDTVFTLNVTDVPDSGTLGTLSINPIANTEGLTANLPIAGATGASVITLQAGALPPGLSLNSANRRLDGTPTAAGDYTFTLRETLAGYTNSPRDTVITLTIQAASATVFTWTTDPTISLPAGATTVEPGMILTLNIGDTDPDTGVRGYRWFVDGVNIGRNANNWTVTEAYLGGVVTAMPLRFDYDTSQDISNQKEAAPVGPIVAVGSGGGDPPVEDTTAPTITSANPSGPYPEFTNINGRFESDDPTATWTVTGTDAASVKIEPDTGYWTILKPNFETKSSYSFSVTATDEFDNASPPMAVSITLTDVVEPVSATSGATWTVPPIINLPNNRVMPRVGMIVSNTPGTTSPATNVKGHRWYVDGVRIGGNTATFVIGPEHLGGMLTTEPVHLSAGGDFWLTSDPIGPILAADPVSVSFDQWTLTSVDGSGNRVNDATVGSVSGDNSEFLRLTARAGGSYPQATTDMTGLVFGEVYTVYMTVPPGLTAENGYSFWVTLDPNSTDPNDWSMIQQSITGEVRGSFVAQTGTHYFIARANSTTAGEFVDLAEFSYQAGEFTQPISQPTTTEVSTTNIIAPQVTRQSPPTDPTQDFAIDITDYRTSDVIEITLTADGDFTGTAEEQGAITDMPYYYATPALTPGTYTLRVDLTRDGETAYTTVQFAVEAA